ncbi:MAG TPA: phosphoenolpyruvate synthase [Nitrososphaeraceae archaeon]|nr:phosphoenolpyruvate synthase [Nitrososphaeraceae archaeon]
MNNAYVVGLDQIGKDDIAIAGGKGANLGEIIKVGIPVPKGFVVTTTSFDRLLEENNLEPRIRTVIEGTLVDNTTKLFEASRKIKEIILSSQMPLEVESVIIEAYETLASEMNKLNSKTKESVFAVAVRSSATAEDLPTASFAGQQATFLNVKDEKDLIESVRRCWASLFEPRAIFYRTKQGVSKSSIAVIVQEMVNSDKSGIIFTIDPSNGQNILLFEAIWGLGESIVSGKITPDMYKVSKERGSKGIILEAQISNKTKMLTRDPKSSNTVEVLLSQRKSNAQVLNEQEILELARYSTMLEDHYGGHPQDIEFAIEGDRIMILQTRAVTTKATKNIETVKSKGTKHKELIKGIGASPGIAIGFVRIIHSNDEITKIQNGEIIVTMMTSPDLVPAMSKSGAIITDLGGRTCHAAIVSRELGIPAIVGTKQATSVLREGQEVTVDAYDGIVYDGRIETDNVLSGQHGMVTSDNTIQMLETVTKLKVNLAFPQRLQEILPKIDGVGLLRIEHMVAQSGFHPAKLIKNGRKEEYVKILMDGIRPIAKALKPKPVRVRTLDARSDEFRNLDGGQEEPIEANPMLGWHGIRRSLDEPELLKAEFEALKILYEDEGLTNLEVMLPFVISTEEVKKAMEIATETSLPNTLKIGIMVETPASVMIIKELCEAKIAFASFGTNDLIQLTLGIDRNNERLAKSSSAFHPAILRSLKMVIDICNQFGIESSICGESGSDLEMAKILVGYGIKSISCNIDAIDNIRKVIYQEERKDMMNAE